MTLEVLGGFGIFDELQEIADLRRQEFAHFVRRSGQWDLDAPSSGRVRRHASGHGCQWPWSSIASTRPQQCARAHLRVSKMHPDAPLEPVRARVQARVQALVRVP